MFLWCDALADAIERFTYWARGRRLQVVTERPTGRPPAGAGAVVMRAVNPGPDENPWKLFTPRPYSWYECKGAKKTISESKSNPN